MDASIIVAIVSSLSAIVTVIISTKASNSKVSLFICNPPYAHGSEATGGLISDNINCSHKNHSPVDGFVRSLI